MRLCKQVAVTSSLLLWAASPLVAGLKLSQDPDDPHDPDEEEGDGEPHGPFPLDDQDPHGNYPHHPYPPPPYPYGAYPHPQPLPHVEPHAHAHPHAYPHAHAYPDAHAEPQLHALPNEEVAPAVRTLLEWIDVRADDVVNVWEVRFLEHPNFLLGSTLSDVALLAGFPREAFDVNMAVLAGAHPEIRRPAVRILIAQISARVWRDSGHEILEELLGGGREMGPSQMLAYIRSKPRRPRREPIPADVPRPIKLLHAMFNPNPLVLQSAINTLVGGRSIITHPHVERIASLLQRARQEVMERDSRRPPAINLLEKRGDKTVRQFLNQYGPLPRDDMLRQILGPYFHLPV